MPTTSRSSVMPSSARSPSRTIRLSSATSTLSRSIAVLDVRDRTSARGPTPLQQVGFAPTKTPADTIDRLFLRPYVAVRRFEQMKFESSVTAVSWIPFEAVKGFLAMPFAMGLAHYDEPLPARLDDLDAWHRRDLFREANELRGWIEVEDGKITGYGQSGS